MPSCQTESRKKPARARLTFAWISPQPVLRAFDLRTHGWQLADAPAGTTIQLVETGRLDPLEWMEFLAQHHLPARRTMIAVGVENASERATLLHIGFGDAVPHSITRTEFVARCERLSHLGQWLPRTRTFLGIELDLLAREALADGASLDLNPREFALLWRLSDTPDQVVSKEDLIHDVWRMGFIPETNSIAVHMSRLRRKLAMAGLSHIIETITGGGYCLRTSGIEPSREFGEPVQPVRSAGGRNNAPLSWLAA